MKNAIFILLLFTFGCGKHSEDRLYHHMQGKIVAVNGNDQELTKEKLHVPSVCNTVLIRDLRDTTLFCELSTCDQKPLIDKSWYYSHHIGDTVRFDYIRKDRYFRVR